MKPPCLSCHLDLIKPFMHAKHIVSVDCAGSASTERVGQEEVDGITCRVTYTW